MKSKLLYSTIFLIIAALGIVSCEYDDTELRDKINDHENRIAQLESLCNQMNTNISSLQTIVAALQGNDYVTSITPVTSGGETIGYTINFSKSGPVTIYHGNDGKDGTNGTDGTNGQDGHTPIIGVKQTSDGNYYWTLDGNWLLDDGGNKIKANGTDGKDGVDGENGHDGNDGSDGLDGKDGITPQLKIEEGYWVISYDNGNSWDQLGKATGENGNDGKDGIDGDSMFSKVTYDEEFVYLVLADNVTTLIIPRRSDDFDLQFVGDNNHVCSSGETVSVSYTLTYGNENTEVAAIPHGGWVAKVEKTSNTSGTITVTAPNPMKDGEVIVLASDGQGKTIMKKLVFEEGVVSIVTKSYVADSDQTTIEVNLSTNLNYTVSIPDDAKSWISVSDIQTKATMRSDIVSLNIAANIGNSTRTANVSFVNSANEVLNTITVSQTGAAIANNEIWYISSDGNIIEPDTYNFAGNIVSNTYGNGKGVIVFENDLTTIWANAYSNAKSLINITLPNEVISINENAFNDCALTSITFSNKLTYIKEDAFARCGNLNKITIPEGVVSIGRTAFNCDGGLIEVVIPHTVTSIDYGAFSLCANLIKINLPDNIKSIEDWTFGGCESLSTINIPEGVVSIGNIAFQDCERLAEIIIPQNVTYLGYGVFDGCDNLSTLYCKVIVPPMIGKSQYYNSISASKKTQIYVPSESVEQYKSAEGWSQYASQIVGYDFTE